MRSLLINEKGGVLLTLLVLTSLLGIGLLWAGQSWKDRMQREREVELLWRGEQYRLAIKSYYKQQNSGVGKQFPLTMNELLEDKRGLVAKKHIRKLYLDPFSKTPFTPILGSDNRIRGVRSASQLKPFKRSGFSKVLLGFDGAGKYSDWAFVYRPPKEKPKEKQAEGQSESDKKESASQAQTN